MSDFTCPLHEECGVFGIYDKAGDDDVAAAAYSALYALQHRGQESCGIAVNVDLVDFKIEFGKTAAGTILLADEISPDTCRFWDAVTHEKLDKDRFRRDLGNVEDAYQEMMKRIFGTQE